MDIDSDIKKVILESNAQYHDYWADSHDKNVPYIKRKITRKYYWKLIEENITSRNIKILGADVLEIGCGTGTFTDLFILNGAKSFKGIDLSERMIEKAKQKSINENYKVPVEFVVDSLENFANNNKCKFDIIQSSSFLHHLSDISFGIESIKSMLKPGGVYIAIHEEITDVQKSFIHKVDEKMQFLFGYGGAGKYSFGSRIKQLLIIIYERILHRFKTIGNQNSSIKKNEKLIENQNEEFEINYVDFQLNKPFSLSRLCSNYGQVKPYCYLAFPELMVFERKNNFELLIVIN